jgi:hypothetical protein
MDDSSINFQAIHQLISFRPNNSGIVAFQSQSKGRARTKDPKKITHNAVMNTAIFSEMVSYFIVGY